MENLADNKTKSTSAAKLTPLHMTYCAMFTVLISVGAFIKIPVPVVPFTLQIFFVYLAGMILGPKTGAVSVLLYAVLGLAGVPVFAEGGGFWYVLKPSFGYIIGFAVAAYVTGLMAKQRSYKNFRWQLLSCFAGLLADYIIGMVYYYLICNYVIGSPIGFWPLFLYCFLLAVPGDIALCFLAAYLVKLIKPHLSEYPVS